MSAVISPRGCAQRWGLAAGPALGLLLYFFLPEAGTGGLGAAGRASAGIAALMAVWWLTEALPLAATALIPVALFPVVGAAGIKSAAAPYAHKLIFLFMGGFMLAGAMERWNLHRRVALFTVGQVGTRPARIVAGFMIATAFLSMWVSNTATTLMMLPIAASVVELALRQGGGGVKGRNFATCLMLGIAYAASIGGMATLIGTPPNALLAAFVEQEYGHSLSFGRWMLLGVPLVFVFLPLCWWLLTRLLYPISVGPVAGRRALDEKIAGMGPLKPAEKRVAAVFVLVAAAWILRPFLKKYIPGLDDAGIAIAGALSLFLLPSGEKGGGPILDWPTAVKLPWGILLIFGGGLSLAKALSRNGVSGYLGGLFSGLSGIPVLGLVLIATIAIVFLTELTSNTATTAALLPVFAAAAAGAGIAPYLLICPVAMGASCAFMMPVATPPNAIVFASGHITIRQMAKAGLWLNIISILLITALVYLLAGPVLGLPN